MSGNPPPTDLGDAERQPYGGLVRLLILLASGVAAMVLVGWSLEYEPFKRIAPGLTSMNPLTAVCFQLVCAALWLLKDGPLFGRARHIVRVLGAVVTTLGGLKLVDLAAGTTLCPDTVMFAAQLDGGQAYPSRMAPNTAFCFFMLGAALMVLDLRGWPSFLGPRTLMVPVALLALFAIIGYAYDTSDFYKAKNYLPMALHTASNFFLLWVAVMFLRPREGVMALVTSGEESGRTTRLLLPFCLLAPVALGAIELQGQRLKLYALGSGTALLVIAIVIVLGAAVLYSAARQRRLEQAREAAAAALAAKQAEQAEQARWSRQLMQLDELVRSSTRNLADAAPMLLSRILATVNAPVGGLYAAPRASSMDAQFEPLALHAQLPREQAADAEEGGLVEQCARGRRIIELRDLPEDYCRIESATVQLQPAVLVLVPVLLNDDVVGVLEMALLKPLEQSERNYIDSAVRILYFVLYRIREARYGLQR